MIKLKLFLHTLINTSLNMLKSLLSQFRKKKEKKNEEKEKKNQSFFFFWNYKFIYSWGLKQNPCFKAVSIAEMHWGFRCKNLKTHVHMRQTLINEKFFLLLLRCCIRHSNSTLFQNDWNFLFLIDILSIYLDWHR